MNEETSLVEDVVKLFKGKKKVEEIPESEAKPQPEETKTEEKSQTEPQEEKKEEPAWLK